MDLRYSWLPGDNPDVVRVREQVAEGGKGLFVVALGGTGVKALIEAYYPEDIREQYRKTLTRYQVADFEMGRLVAVSELFQWVGELHPLRITEIKRNSRNARRDLRRSHSQEDHKIALRNAEEDRVASTVDDWSSSYADAMAETVKAHKPKNTPKRR